ncbi:MAG: 3-isopropylmalate dehydrogenase [Proteobacteria bacterium SG_bin6]|nr:MAG: 3-isopropylmalate dehydrogenase [Proteobacteria bacterium SG_bin6]
MRLAVLPGDGIGPEVTAEAVAALRLAADQGGFALELSEHPFGGAAIDACGTPLPEATLAACRAADGLLMGAVGGPAWDNAPQRPEAGLLALRAALGLYANLRPARVIPGLEALSPLRPELARGTDILVVRELTGGLYFGAREEGAEAASDLCAYSAQEVTRVAHVAFRAAQGRRGRVTLVDKANVLATSRLWRRVVTRVAAEYPGVTLDHLYVDAAAMELVRRPARFDVILTENLFGDILSDQLSAVAGSIGLLGSASLGNGGPGLFEPIHGSAPDIAGRGIANPAGAIASAAMLLDALGQGAAARALHAAIEAAVLGGCRTRDLGGAATTAELGAAIRTAFAATTLEAAA